MAGWLKLHRKILESQVFSDPDLLRLWIMLLCRANFKPSFFRGREIGVGQVAFSQRLFCDSLGVSKGKLHRDLNRLKLAGMITIEAGRDFSVASVCNWETYQSPEEDERGSGGALVGRTGGADGSLPKKLTIQESPPPTPSGQLRSQSGGWREVEEKLIERKIALAPEATATADARGLTPAAVLELIDDWDRHGGAWGPGALFQRITGQLAHWPPVAASHDRRAAGESVAKATLARRAEQESIAHAAHREAVACNDRVPELLRAIAEMDEPALQELYIEAYGNREAAAFEMGRSSGGRLPSVVQSRALATAWGGVASPTEAVA